MAQMAFGALERFSLKDREAVAVSGEKQATAARAGHTYRYRILVFEGSSRHPVYAVNLETSILGGWMLSEQDGPRHRVLERLAAPLPYDQFRIRALEYALSALR